MGVGRYNTFKKELEASGVEQHSRQAPDARPSDQARRRNGRVTEQQLPFAADAACGCVTRCLLLLCLLLLLLLLRLLALWLLW
ncbi:hypothetical protein LSTR_LSTR001661 [Laodelphax striatellus]|uniref:Uncharacterized protein n=1 Tax=Laodelphax striatellus TaxID=195883 RepID=A0A482XCY5_LAOST|nr:hypothetical protein LSTR_LSTR001661 [Laodelphax striatellus]